MIPVRPPRPFAGSTIRAQLIAAGLVVPREDRLTVQRHVLPSPVLRCALRYAHEADRAQTQWGGK